jgi:hypothetical protein
VYAHVCVFDALQAHKLARSSPSTAGPPSPPKTFSSRGPRIRPEPLGQSPDQTLCRCARSRGPSSGSVRAGPTRWFDADCRPLDGSLVAELDESGDIVFRLGETSAEDAARVVNSPEGWGPSERR